MAIDYRPVFGERTGNLFAVHIDGQGRPQMIGSSSYHNGRVIFARNSLSLYGVGYQRSAVAVFTDTDGHWAGADIDFVTSRGLMGGAGGAFLPNEAVTRADFIMALGRLSGADVNGYLSGSFTDVAGTSPAMPYIEWAVAHSIVSGMGDNRFEPYSTITREQMAAMMVNYARATNYRLPLSREAVVFADNELISAWAAEAVRSIQQAGVLSGRDNNYFDPQGAATRGEAATIIRRFVELIIDEGTARGWVRNDSGTWRFIDTFGRAATGWHTAENGERYWFGGGVMAAGAWVQIDGRWYYFHADGRLALNTVIDGYEVGADSGRRD